MQAKIEIELYNAEATYLTETTAHSGGNILQGFDGYLKNQTVARRKHDVSNTDRLFSNSSLTLQKAFTLAFSHEKLVADLGPHEQALDSAGDVEEPSAPEEVYPSKVSAGITTVSLPAANVRSQEAAAQKKLRDKEYQRRKRANNKLPEETDDDSSVSAPTGRARKRLRLADDD